MAIFNSYVTKDQSVIMGSIKKIKKETVALAHSYNFHPPPHLFVESTWKAILEKYPQPSVALQFVYPYDPCFTKTLRTSKNDIPSFQTSHPKHPMANLTLQTTNLFSF